MSRTAPALSIPAHLHERQTTASDPTKSIWVAANAGSGKTHVLTQRVIRLLLRGVPPAKILCLTFTKAAAAQMATRVFATLSGWTMLDDGALRAAIVATGAPPPDAADLLLARRLFTRTVETPGGLKIQTIHAFCERLLHLFPFEANVPARFEVADERRTEEMLSLAKRAAIADAKGSAALALVADIAGGFGLEALIAQSMKLRGTARRVMPDEQATLGTRLGGGAFESVDAVRRSMVLDGLAPARWPAIADVMDSGGATDKAHALRLRSAGSALGEDPTDVASVLSPSLGQVVRIPIPDPSPRGGTESGGTNLQRALKTYLGIFFDSKQAPRSRLMTNKLAAAHPTVLAELEEERDRLDVLRANLKTAETVERTQALVALVDAVMDRYDRAKTAQGLLDFDDLIDRTLTLLDRSDSGWVLHKLDAGIDHVLVDEAQDTSEAQWKILERLTDDFAAGETGRTATRSFFVVGDDKQSIFSFQGAAPLMFDAMRGRFERRFKAGRKSFERVSLKTSFRSVPGILAAVDTVFTEASHQDGLVQPGDSWPMHDSIKAGLPGLVEIWPRLGAVASPDPEDWSIPLDTPAEKDPVNLVADRVARKIKDLIAPMSQERVHDGGSDTTRPIRPGDILILVRTRGTFFEAVIRALKHHYVPVAGADRLDVANHIAVMDLVAAGRTALVPADDLSLACLLKSPLFGLTDDDLIALAPSRSGSLFDALAASVKTEHRAAFGTIEHWAARAANLTPFVFYVELLGRDGGRRLMEARLGPEAHDAIDEFLRLALAHEQQGAPSLGAFLTDVEALESSIKRDMEAPGDAVRVMTVHAAKGLEAKIVFLPDTCAVPAPTLDPNVFDLNKGSDRPPLLVWSPRKADDPPLVEEARAAERQATLREYRRLLYVALTRAEERLYIAGFYNSREPPDDSWNAMIERAFLDADTVEAPWDDGDVVRRIATLGSTAAVGSAKHGRSEQGDLRLPPDWLWCPVETSAAATSLRPSRPRRDSGKSEQRESLTYGSALHMLLQYLPGMPAERRESAGRAALVARHATIPAQMHDQLLAEAFAVMGCPDLAPLFGVDARAEVAIIGQLACADGSVRNVRGTVDRLLVKPDEVVVADFKTGTPEDPPPRRYIEQMALYRRVLSSVWPDRRLAMRLVWARGPQMVDLEAAVLENAAAALLSAA